jgi:glutamate racemase
MSSITAQSGRGPTIGVFDSGFGGLTVLRALLPLIPGAHYVYLGDTARLPYGAKSATTIARYAVESAQFLASQGAELIVIACNTATALALPQIRQAVPVPVIGVIEPGAKAALAALNFTLNLSYRSAAERPASRTTPTPEVLVLATPATVQSHAYRHACEALGLKAAEFPCPLLVPLTEEGWTDHPVTRDVLRIYLAEALTLCQPDIVLLGCTHYPLLAGQIELILRELGSHAKIIDSAEATAQTIAAHFQKLRPSDPQPPGSATFTCYATDSTEKFQRLGSIFLYQPIPTVALLDLGG